MFYNEKLYKKQSVYKKRKDEKKTLLIGKDFFSFIISFICENQVSQCLRWDMSYVVWKMIDFPRNIGNLKNDTMEIVQHGLCYRY